MPISRQRQDMGTKRIIEGDEENIRKAFSKDLFTDARLLDNPLILRNVDEDAINKCRLSLYGQQSRLVARHSYRTEEYDQMEKCRDTHHDTRLDARDFALEQSVEEIYFNYYGHGYNDSPVIDRPGAPYTCPCGLKMAMNAKSFPPECPKCKRLTPIGELMRDGVMKSR